MKGLGWLLVGALFTGILFQCSAAKKVPQVSDYCNLKGEGLYVGEIIGGTLINGGVLMSLVNPSNKACPFQVMIRGEDMAKVKVGDVLRFKGSLNGPYLAYRDLEINPSDGVGLSPSTASIKVNVVRSRLFRNRNWDGSYWFQLVHSQYGGERLVIDRRWLNEIKTDGCYRMSWDRNKKIVGVGKCSS